MRARASLAPADASKDVVVGLDGDVLHDTTLATALAKHPEDTIKLSVVRPGEPVVEGSIVEPAAVVDDPRTRIAAEGLQKPQVREMLEAFRREGPAALQRCQFRLAFRGGWRGARALSLIHI